MALVACFECQKDVSEVAASCPHCGYPLAKRRAQIKLSSTLAQAKEFVGYRLNLTNEKFALLQAKLSPCTAPISLRRINGIGFRFGSVQPIFVEGQQTRYALGLLVFTFIFIPLIPLGFNIVEPSNGGYVFTGKVSFVEAHQIFGKDIAVQALTKTLFEAALFLGVLFILFALVFAIHNL